MKVKKLEDGKFQITISEDMAGVLVTICQKIGGDPNRTPRMATDKLKDLLINAFGKTNSINSNPFRSFPTQKFSAVYFEPCSMEKLKKDVNEDESEL